MSYIGHESVRDRERECELKACCAVCARHGISSCPGKGSSRASVFNKHKQRLIGAGVTSGLNRRPNDSPSQHRQPSSENRAISSLMYAFGCYALLLTCASQMQAGRHFGGLDYIMSAITRKRGFAAARCTLVAHLCLNRIRLFQHSFDPGRPPHISTSHARIIAPS